MRLHISGEKEEAELILWMTIYAIIIVMHMSAMAIILRRNMVFLMVLEIEVERSVTRVMDISRATMEIARIAMALRFADRICEDISSVSSFEIETISSLDASLRKDSYLLLNRVIFRLLDTGAN